jgi:hypothetical protein
MCWVLARWKAAMRRRAHQSSSTPTISIRIDGKGGIDETGQLRTSKSRPRALGLTRLARRHRGPTAEGGTLFPCVPAGGDQVLIGLQLWGPAKGSRQPPRSTCSRFLGTVHPHIPDGMIVISGTTLAPIPFAASSALQVVPLFADA